MVDIDASRVGNIVEIIRGFSNASKARGVAGVHDGSIRHVYAR